MLSLLKPIIKHFSKSTISAVHLQKECRVDDIGKTVNALQNISQTIFGTHWSAAESSSTSQIYEIL